MESASETARRTARGLMAAQGLRQEDLAPILGLSQQALSSRLRGRSRLTLDDVEALAAYFDVPVSLFFEGITRKMNCGPTWSTLLAVAA